MPEMTVVPEKSTIRDKRPVAPTKMPTAEAISKTATRALRFLISPDIVIVSVCPEMGTTEPVKRLSIAPTK
jgi:hypothetical protein